MRDFRLCFFLLVIPCSALAADLFVDAPPAPPGFATFAEAQAAFFTGKVPRIEAPSVLPDTIEVLLDVEYATHDGVPLMVDIYKPAKIEKPAPALLMIHGGGWSQGNKDDCLFYAARYAELGYVAVAVQYRLTPDHQFPAAIQDVKCAIAWMRAHAAEYHIDPDHIVVMGGSAGGHLALLAGYAQDPALECPDGKHADTRVQGIVNLYGVVDNTAPVAQEAPQVTSFIGKSYADAPELYALSSPIHHLDKGDPPTLTFHGTIDELVPLAQADQLHARLDELGIPNYVDRIEGWPHSMDLAQLVNDRIVHIIDKFLAEYAPLPK